MPTDEPNEQTLARRHLAARVGKLPHWRCRLLGCLALTIGLTWLAVARDSCRPGVAPPLDLIWSSRMGVGCWNAGLAKVTCVPLLTEQGASMTFPAIAFGQDALALYDADHRSVKAYGPGGLIREWPLTSELRDGARLKRLSWVRSSVLADVAPRSTSTGRGERVLRLAPDGGVSTEPDALEARGCGSAAEYAVLRHDNVVEWRSGSGQRVEVGRLPPQGQWDALPTVHLVAFADAIGVRLLGSKGLTIRRIRALRPWSLSFDEATRRLRIVQQRGAFGFERWATRAYDLDGLPLSEQVLCAEPIDAPMVTPSEALWQALRQASAGRRDRLTDLPGRGGGPVAPAGVR